MSETPIDQLWDYDRPEVSERRFREALTQTKDPSRQAELLTQIARAQGLQRQFDAAHATLAEAEALITAHMTPARIRLLLERGRVLNSSGHREASIPLFAQAHALARDAGEDFLAIDAVHMLSIGESPEAALAWNEQAIALAEQSSDDKARRWLGSLYNNIGWTYHDMRRYDDALAMFERGLRWREDNYRGPQDDRAIRIAKWSVARTLRSLDRLEEALALQRALLGELEAAGQRDGYMYEELAECLLALHRQEEARPYFALAHEMLSTDAWLAANEPERLRRLDELRLL